MSAVSNAYTINAVSGGTTGFSGAIEGILGRIGFGISAVTTLATGINYGVYGTTQQPVGVGVSGDRPVPRVPATVQWEQL